ncbi:hypothetical protein D3C75_539100 [compost metagenome]
MATVVSDCGTRRRKKSGSSGAGVSGAGWMLRVVATGTRHSAKHSATISSGSRPRPGRSTSTS